MTEEPIAEISEHAAGVLRAALSAGSHAATILVQRQERRAREKALDADRTGSTATQRADALELVRDLPPATGPGTSEAAPERTGAEQRYDEVWRDEIVEAGASEELADEIGASPGLAGLVEECERVRATQDEPGTLPAALAAGVTGRSFDGVRDPAAVLRHRVAEHVDGPAPVVPGAGGAVPASARGPRSRPHDARTQEPDARPGQSRAGPLNRPRDIVIERRPLSDEFLDTWRTSRDVVDASWAHFDPAAAVLLAEHPSGHASRGARYREDGILSPLLLVERR